MAEEGARLVTVVMPVRNEEAGIEAALDSVLDQTWPELEVLVVDGESEDATRDVAARYAARDPRVRLCRNPGRIIPTGLNVGLEHAHGDYLMRVDGHWSINRTYIETALRLLDERPDVAVIGGRREAVAADATGRAIACALSSKFGVGNSLYHYGTSQQETDHAAGGVYRIRVLRAVGGWDGTLPVNEDVDLDHRIRKIGHRILFEPTMVSRWRAQESLRDLGRQYRRYGRGKAQMLRKNGVAALRARHLAAPLVVLALPTSVGAALLGRWRVALWLGVPYPVALALASTVTNHHQPPPRSGTVPLAGAFATMHLAWGAGILEGLIWGAPPAHATARGAQPPARFNQRRPRAAQRG